jgi:parallel beta-helix repeat protein
MAAVFVILAGGANALALRPSVVWCVTKTSYVPNPACTPATTFTTITAVLSNSSPPGPIASFDVIVVAPGYYNESVEITNPNISIFGAQAGRDARVDRWNPANESIVDATNQESTSGVGGGGAAFRVGASNVTIDGFTIEGGGVVTTNPLGPNASGIYVGDYPSVQILNNIIQNNAVGVFLSASLSSLVEYNLFKTNNAGAAGVGTGLFSSMAGFGLAANDPQWDAITENQFKGNMATAIDMLYGTDMQVTNNTSEKDGAFAVLVGGQGNSVSHNQGQNFCPKLPLPETTPSSLPAEAAIDVGRGGEYLQVNDNDLEEGRTAEYNGIAFSIYFGSGYCLNCEVSNNKIKQFAGDGIIAETMGGSETLNSSLITGNDVERNGYDGILIANGLNYNNTFADNLAEGNHVNDCEDYTYYGTPGIGTGDTHNTWFNNIGPISDPPGICAPRMW